MQPAEENKDMQNKNEDVQRRHVKKQHAPQDVGDDLHEVENRDLLKTIVKIVDDANTKNRKNKSTVKVKTRSGTEDEVSRDDLEAAGDTYDKLTKNENLLTKHWKKIHASRVREKEEDKKKSGEENTSSQRNAQVVVDEGIEGLVSAGIKGAKMCAGNSLCRKAAIAAGTWGLNKLKDKFKDKPEQLPEYTDTEMQPDYSHPSFQASFENARAKLERDRWLAINGKKASHLAKKESVEVHKRNELIERFKRVVLGEQEVTHDYREKWEELNKQQDEAKARRKKRQEARQKARAEVSTEKKEKSQISYRDIENKDPHLTLKKTMGKERYKDWLELSTSPQRALTPGERDRLRIHNNKVRHVMPSAIK